MAEPFDQLQAAKWRDVEFPVASMTISFAHDLAEHKYWGVDGARVEATGLNPLHFSFEIPMHQGIVPGKAEKWRAGSLYPTEYRKLLVAFAQKLDGTLIHPDFGAINCKAEKLDIRYDGGRRGGPTINASFIETLPDDDVRLAAPPLPTNEMEAAAKDLDASELDLRGLAPRLPAYDETLTDLMRRITGVVDQFGLLAQRQGGQIDNMLYRVNTLSDSVDRLRSAQTWSITQNIERIRAAAYNLREQLLQDTRPITIFRVPGDTSLAGLAATLKGADIGDLVKLNPTIVATPVVEKGTKVRYYATKKAA